MGSVIRFSGKANDRDTARTRQLVCNVWAIKGGEVGDAVFSGQPISVGPGLAEAPSQLTMPEAGKYLVELVHPRGRHTRRIIEIAEGKELLFDVPQFLSSKSSSASFERSIDGGAVARVVMSSTSTRSTTPELEVLAFATSHRLDASLMNPRGFIAGVLSSRRQGYSIARFTETQATDFVAKLPTDTSLDVSPPRGRAWVLARGGTERWTLISYPETWSKKDGVAPFVLRAQRPDSPSVSSLWNIRLELEDPSLEALMEYLSSGDWPSVQALYKVVNRLGTNFDFKTQEPFTAAIAAYVDALAGNEELKWSEMVANCLAGNYWMADIGIAIGWTLLREVETNSSSFVQARQLILGAVERGLPYFTIGLRVLSDALNYLTVVDAKDQPAKRALVAVTRASLACSKDEVFTTVDVSRYLDFVKKS